MALKIMAEKRPGELTTAKEVVAVVGCPFDATARVLQQMANFGVLRSEQGAYGGYQIIKDLGKLSLHDLISAVLGPIRLVKCLKSSHNQCDLIDGCNVQSPLRELNRRLLDFYKGVTVAELLRERGYGREIKEITSEKEAGA